MAARRSTIDKENRVGGTSAYSPSAYLKHVDADSYRSQVGSLTQCLCVCGGGLDGTLDGLLVRLCSTTAVRVAGRPLFPRMHPHIPSPSVLPAALSRARSLTPPALSRRRVVLWPPRPFALSSSICPPSFYSPRACPLLYSLRSHRVLILSSKGPVPPRPHVHDVRGQHQRQAAPGQGHRRCPPA